MATPPELMSSVFSVSVTVAVGTSERVVKCSVVELLVLSVALSLSDDSLSTFPASEE